MKDASTFDTRQCWIRLPLNISWKSAHPYGAYPAWTATEASRSGPALGPASFLDHLNRVHASPRFRASFPSRRRTPLFLRLPKSRRNPTAGFVSMDELPGGPTLLSPALLGAPRLIRLTFGPIRLGERESWLRKPGSFLAHVLFWWCNRVLKNGPAQKTRPQSSVSGVPGRRAEVPLRWFCELLPSAFLGLRTYSCLVIRPLPTDCASSPGEGWAVTNSPAGSCGAEIAGGPPQSASYYGCQGL